MSIKTVSVIMPTYNHEKFIAQAIESVLMQKTDFNTELIIGEDFSQDNTRNICRQYWRQQPEKIKILNSEKHLGGPAIFKMAYNICEGKYVAMLEGDDYWTDPYKLQKQVDFLKTQPGYAMSFHNAGILFGDQLGADLTYCGKNQKDTSTIEDLFYSDFVPTCSIVFNKEAIRKLPDLYHGAENVDWVLLILIAQYGKIKYHPEVMGVYRIHEKGMWSSKNKAEKHLSVIRTYKILENYFASNSNYLHHILMGKAGTYYELAKEYHGRNDLSNTLRYLFLSWRANQDKYHLKKYLSFIRKCFIDKSIAPKL